jgi:hypothetical protein
MTIDYLMLSNPVDQYCSWCYNTHIQQKEQNMTVTQAISICEQYRIDHSVSGFLLESLQSMLAAKQRNELTAEQRVALQTVMNEGLRLVEK